MNTDTPRIFVSYTRKGNGPKWKTRLLESFRVFERLGLIDVWEDGKLRVSSFWDDDIKQAIACSNAAVVLLTPEALESEYIVDTELPALEEGQRDRGISVYPIVCEDCDWRSFDLLRNTLAAHAERPLINLSELEIQRALSRITHSIAKDLSQRAISALVADNPERSDPLANGYFDRFPLGRDGVAWERRLIGRDQELSLLDLALAHARTNIVALVAWGGVGKTMLVRQWLQRGMHEGWLGRRRIYAWSFYSQGTNEDRQTSEDSFLAHALAWFGRQVEPSLPPWEKGRILAEAVEREGAIVILDGIEPLQYPPGPRGGQLRSVGVQSLLKHLARQTYEDDDATRPFCIVTTREPLSDLVELRRDTDAPWGRLVQIDLQNLNHEAGAAVLHQAGVTKAGRKKSIEPDDNELQAVSREVGGHALTLMLLGRYLARAHGGDVRQRDQVQFSEADRREQGGATFRMLATFERWFENEGEIEARALAILRLLGLFDRPADEGCINTLREQPVIPGLTDPLFSDKRSKDNTSREQPLSKRALNDAEHYLSDFGLITLDVGANGAVSLDCHPLIREFFASRLSSTAPESWRVCHQRLYRYLETQAEEQPDNLDELQPLYEAVRHGCLAGMSEEARCGVYRNRILRGPRGSDAFYSLKKLGAYDSDLRALRCMFDVPWTKPADAIPSSSHGWLLNTASYCLLALGRVEEAAVLAAESVKRTDSLDIRNLALRQNESASLLTALGRLKEAQQQAENACKTTDPPPGTSFAAMGVDESRRPDVGAQVAAQTTLANIHHLRGNQQRALELFQSAEQKTANDPDERARFEVLYSLQGYEYCDLLLAEADRWAWRIKLHGIDSPYAPAESQVPDLVAKCIEVETRAKAALEKLESEGATSLFDQLAAHLSCASAMMVAALLCLREPRAFSQLIERGRRAAELAVSAARTAGSAKWLTATLLVQARIAVHYGRFADAEAELDEAWDIASRANLRLLMADIRLYRTRLFFQEPGYPWSSPVDDLEGAATLVKECGYHRRDEEIQDTGIVFA